MRKLLATLSIIILLTAAMACPASAETCYTSLVKIFTDSYGTPDVVQSHDVDKAVMLLIDLDNNYVAFEGINSQGQGEMTLWIHLSASTVMGVLGVLCSSWDSLVSMTDRGYEFSIGYILNGEVETITTALKAKSVASVIGY